MPGPEPSVGVLGVQTPFVLQSQQCIFVFVGVKASCLNCFWEDFACALVCINNYCIDFRVLFLSVVRIILIR